MLTNNFVSAYKGCVGETPGNDYAFVNPSGSQRNFNSANCRIFLQFRNRTDISVPTETGCTIAVGTGIAAESPSNVNMANMITSSDVIKIVAQSSAIYFNSNNSSLGTIARTIQNVSSDPITITEIGLWGRTDSYPGEFLLYREVLDTPVTLAPGKKYTFTIDLCVA